MLAEHINKQIHVELGIADKATRKLLNLFKKGESRQPKQIGIEAFIHQTIFP